MRMFLLCLVVGCGSGVCVYDADDGLPRPAWCGEGVRKTHCLRNGDERQHWVRGSDCATEGYGTECFEIDADIPYTVFAADEATCVALDPELAAEG